MIIEGMLALTGQHFIIEYNEEQGTLPGFVEGFTNISRDEHRHVAFGARFLRDMAQRDPRYPEAIQRTLVECGPAADGVLRPPVVRRGRRTRGVWLHHRGDPGLCGEGAEAPPEGHRPRPGDRLGPARKSAPPPARRRSGRSKITFPCSSGAPSTSTSDMNGPICRGGKFTTASTRRPSSSSRE